MSGATRWCPVCASTDVAPRGGHHWRCHACGVTDWQNPHPVAGAFIVQDGRVLLVRRARHLEQGAGGWVFPGGYVERGETPWEAAVRETIEEAGVRVRILAALPPRTVLHPHNVVMPFLAALAPGEQPRPGVESEEVRWFALDDIPWDEVPFSTTVEALRGIVAGDRGTQTFRRVSSPGRPRPHFAYCARCGAPLGGPHEDGALRCSVCGAVRWDNPSPCAAFLAVHDRRVLLGQRRPGRDGAGLWAIPAGHMEPGEAPTLTAERELLEETGLTGHAQRFVALFASGDHCEAVYLGVVDDPAHAASEEFTTLDWFTGPQAAALPGHHGTPDLVRWARAEGLLD